MATPGTDKSLSPHGDILVGVTDDKRMIELFEVDVRRCLVQWSGGPEGGAERAWGPGKLSEGAHAYPRVQALPCPCTPQNPLWEMPAGRGNQYLRQVGAWVGHPTAEGVQVAIVPNATGPSLP